MPTDRQTFLLLTKHHLTNIVYSLSEGIRSHLTVFGLFLILSSTKMGMPITSNQGDSSTQQENLSSSSSVDYSMNAHGNNNINNGVESEGGVSHLFVYGSSRPDAPATAQNQLGFHNRKAWLLGSRLYSFDTGGVQRAAVKLDEAGHAVLGYAISTNNSLGITSLLDEYERREYSPDFYERDIVEVVTERGEHLQAYIYHRADVNPRNLIPSGDWLRQ